MGDRYSLSPNGFWGNFAPVNPLLNFLRNILISKWLPVAPSPDVLITHLVSPPDSWNWMVISHFIFTVVIRKQFLVCKLHTGNVTMWNMSRLDSWIWVFFQGFWNVMVQRYSTDMRYINISTDLASYLLMFWYIMKVSLKSL